MLHHNKQNRTLRRLVLGSVLFLYSKSELYYTRRSCKHVKLTASFCRIVKDIGQRDSRRKPCKGPHGKVVGAAVVESKLLSKIIERVKAVAGIEAF